MPSWNEKAHVIPTINVNLSGCMQNCRMNWLRMTSGSPLYTIANPQHRDGCPGIPVLVPLPLEPWRSVTMTVRLGECSCDTFEAFRKPGQHFQHCPARSVRVTCSIGGKDWASSDVVDVEPREARETHGYDVLNACRSRWALVKALLSGMDLNEWSVTQNTQQIIDLWNQRDAVFAALADMARHEAGIIDAVSRLEQAFMQPVAWTGERPLVGALTCYVERLIEQVGVMP